jgi:hypothetical protein
MAFISMQEAGLRSPLPSGNNEMNVTEREGMACFGVGYRESDLKD